MALVFVFLPSSTVFLSLTHTLSEHCDDLENERLIGGVSRRAVGKGRQPREQGPLPPFRLPRFLEQQEALRERLHGDLENFYAAVISHLFDLFVPLVITLLRFMVC